MFDSGLFVFVLFFFIVCACVCACVWSLEIYDRIGSYLAHSRHLEGFIAHIDAILGVRGESTSTPETITPEQTFGLRG